MILELNHDNFEESVSSGTVLVDFWAPWCGPCHMIAPTIEQLARENPNVKFTKLNVDEYPEIASRHGVMSIPTLLFFVDGVLKDNTIGVVPKAVIERKLESLKV